MGLKNTHVVVLVSLRRFYGVFEADLQPMLIIFQVPTLGGSIYSIRAPILRLLAVFRVCTNRAAESRTLASPLAPHPLPFIWKLLETPSLGFRVSQFVIAALTQLSPCQETQAGPP